MCSARHAEDKTVSDKLSWERTLSLNTTDTCIVHKKTNRDGASRATTTLTDQLHQASTPLSSPRPRAIIELRGRLLFKSQPRFAHMSREFSYTVGACQRVSWIVLATDLVHDNVPRFDALLNPESLHVHVLHIAHMKMKMPFPQMHPYTKKETPCCVGTVR